MLRGGRTLNHVSVLILVELSRNQSGERLDRFLGVRPMRFQLQTCSALGGQRSQIEDILPLN